MSAPQVLIRADRKALSPIGSTAPQTAWRALGRVGLLLAVIASVDVAVRWYPLAFRSPEWEFGTVAMTFASMPLIAIGLVAALASALAVGSRLGVTTMAAVFVVLCVFSIAALLLFVSDVPVAMNALRGPSVPPGAVLEMKRTVVRAGAMGVGFVGLFAYGSVVSLRFLSRRFRDV